MKLDVTIKIQSATPAEVKAIQAALTKLVELPNDQSKDT